MGTFWLGTWLAQSITGLAVQRGPLDHHPDRVSWPGVVISADFWWSTLQTGIRSSWHRLHHGLRSLPARAWLARVEAGLSASRINEH